MIDLYGLPIKLRIIFRIILLTFKAIHGLAPVYLSDVLSLQKHVIYDLQSNDTNVLSWPGIKSAKTTGDRAFFVAVPALWNILPPSLKTVANINTFKGLTVS